MSIHCLYEQLQVQASLGHSIRLIQLEGKLAIPDHLPEMDTIIMSDLTLGPTSYVIDNEQLVVTGRAYPRMIYKSREESGFDQNHGMRRRDEAYEIQDADKETSGEYGVFWENEDSMIFEEIISIPGLMPGMRVESEITPVESIFTRGANRSIQFSAKLQLQIKISSTQTMPCIGNLNGQTEKLNISREQLQLENEFSNHLFQFNMRPTLNLPQLKPGITRILLLEANPTGLTWETVRNRIIIKGYLEVNLIYVGADDDGLPTQIFVNRWTRESGSAIPIETAVDINDSDGHPVIVPHIHDPVITGTLRSYHEIQTQITVSGEVRVTRVSRRDVVTGVTPGAGEIIDTRASSLSFEEFLGETDGEIPLDLQLSFLPGLPGPEQILSYRGRLREIRTESAESGGMAEGRILLEGMLELQILYLDESGELRLAVWEQKNGNSLPVAGMIESPDLSPGADVEANLSLDNLHLEPEGDQSLRLTALIKVRAYARAPRNLPVLADFALVNPVDPSSRPSMLFYVAQPGDTLWKVARRYQTTVATLIRANQITEPDNLEVGQKLIIPKQI